MSSEEADALVTKSVDQLFCKACHVIDKYLSEEEKASKENDLFTPPRSNTRKGRREASSSKSLLQATTAVYTIGSLVIICPSLDLKSIVPILYSMITSGTPDPTSNKLPGSTILIKEKAPCLYIQAWLTMGKVCLADGKLAKRFIPLFVQVSLPHPLIFPRILREKRKTSITCTVWFQLVDLQNRTFFYIEFCIFFFKDILPIGNLELMSVSV